MDKIISIVTSIILLGLIVWWFFGKHKISSEDAIESEGIQRVEIIVDGGYKPEVITLKSGLPAEVTFLRKTSSSCFDEVLLPDFGEQAKLPVGKPYTFQLEPKKPGSYQYSCGMHMFFGKIEVVK